MQLMTLSKARVERIIPYIRDSFWSGRDFTSLEEINKQAMEWCLKVAGTRQHGTTHQQPLSLSGRGYALILSYGQALNILRPLK